jgi:outer membrane protein assembly factor BamB
MEQSAGIPDQRRRQLGVHYPRPGHGRIVRAGRQSLSGLCDRRARGGNLYTGSIVVLDAKTGAYKRHFKLVQKDWHDWDVVSPPTLFRTAGGKKLLAEAPKDGYLYGIDLESNAVNLRVPVTKIENIDAPFSVDAEVHFCPGVNGGAAWNGPAYDPQTNLILVGEINWCTSVKMQTEQEIRDVPAGGFWTGMVADNPFQILGIQDDGRGAWSGWVYAVDADSGVWKWRLKSNYPILGGMTPTAGGLAFFGDVGGNFYALDAATGEKLWVRRSAARSPAALSPIEPEAEKKSPCRPAIPTPSGQPSLRPARSWCSGSTASGTRREGSRPGRVTL